MDPAGIVDIAFAADLAAARSSGVQSPIPVRLIRYDALEPALDALRARTVSAVYEIDADYVATGRVTGYALQSEGSFGQALIGQRQGAVSDAIRASLLRTRVDADAVARVYAPMARFQVRTVAVDGEVVLPNSRFALNTFLGSVAIVLLLTIAIFFSAGFLQQATTEDRQNRVIEVLLSSTTSDELLLGKIIGLGGAGLLQLAVYIVLVIVPGATIAAVFTVPLVPFLLSLVYFVIGYLLYAALVGGTGMLGRRPLAALGRVRRDDRAGRVHRGEPAVLPADARSVARRSIRQSAVVLPAQQSGRDDSAAHVRPGSADRHRWFDPDRHRLGIFLAPGGVEDLPGDVADVRQEGDARRGGALAACGMTCVDGQQLDP